MHVLESSGAISDLQMLDCGADPHYFACSVAAVDGARRAPFTPSVLVECGSMDFRIHLNQAHLPVSGVQSNGVDTKLQMSSVPYLETQAARTMISFSARFLTFSWEAQGIVATSRPLWSGRTRRALIVSGSAEAIAKVVKVIDRKRGKLASR